MSVDALAGAFILLLGMCLGFWGGRVTRDKPTGPPLILKRAVKNGEEPTGNYFNDAMDGRLKDED